MGHRPGEAGQFHPTALDARQWVRAFKAAGLRGVVLTAKHHDGFCLWPTRRSSHSVAGSEWKEGKGDVLREVSEACRAEGLLFGVYLSPWDRNHPTYGSDAYNDVFVAMLEEVLTGYGPVFEVWFDGACGEGPSGKRQVYDWPRYVATVRKHAPDAVIFSDAGPDIRWVGNEKGFAPETSWALLERERFVPGTELSGELGEGHEKGTHWVPSECDVSIRPGWFWRASETPKVKDGATLFDLYERSVGRNANFLLNVPPTTAGVVDDADVKALADFGTRVRAVYRIESLHGGRVHREFRSDAGLGGPRRRPRDLVGGARGRPHAVPHAYAQGKNDDQPRPTRRGHRPRPTHPSLYRRSPRRRRVDVARGRDDRRSLPHPADPRRRDRRDPRHRDGRARGADARRDFPPSRPPPAAAR
jgi:alpha-L-fucosidase